MKRSTVYCIEETNWFGECNIVEDGFHSEAEADQAIKKFRSHAKHCEKKADKVRYSVACYVWEREA